MSEDMFKDMFNVWITCDVSEYDKLIAYVRTLRDVKVRDLIRSDVM